MQLGGAALASAVLVIRCAPKTWLEILKQAIVSCFLFSLGGGGWLDVGLLSAVTARSSVGFWRRGLIIMTLKDRAGLASIRCWLFVSVCVFAVMLHGLPISKVKRESSPSKELSPCRKLQADMCLYSYRYKKKKKKKITWCLMFFLVLDISVTIRSCARQLPWKPDTSFLFHLLSACDIKPAGLKALNPASTPVQCGSTHPTGPQPVKRDLQPPAPQLTGNCPPSHIPALSPSHHHNIPQANQSQHFALPRPSISCPSASFNSEPRWVLTHTICDICF